MADKCDDFSDTFVLGGGVQFVGLMVEFVGWIGSGGGGVGRVRGLLRGIINNI